MNRLSALLRSFVYAWPNFLRQLQWPLLSEWLDIGTGMTVVDLGSGHMQLAVRLAKRFRVNVLAIDMYVSRSRGEWAKRKGVLVLAADGYVLPLKDRSVDRILLSSIIQMVPQPDLLLAECRRVLKNEGCVVITAPNQYMFIPALFNSSTPAILRKLLRLPGTYEEFIQMLNKRFNVQGESGYFSKQHLIELVARSDFTVSAHAIAPGAMSSLIWEVGVVTYFRFGRVVFLVLPFLLPIARIGDKFWGSSLGGEHVVLGRPARS